MKDYGKTLNNITESPLDKTSKAVMPDERTSFGTTWNNRRIGLSFCINLGIEVKIHIRTRTHCLASTVRRAVDSDNARLVKNNPFTHWSIELQVMLPGPRVLGGMVLMLVVFPTDLSSWLVSETRETNILSGCQRLGRLSYKCCDHSWEKSRLTWIGERQGKFVMTYEN